MNLWGEYIVNEPIIIIADSWSWIKTIKYEIELSYLMKLSFKVNANDQKVAQSAGVVKYTDCFSTEG